MVTALDYLAEGSTAELLECLVAVSEVVTFDHFVEAV
jgi:hypothetical protein